MAQYAPNVNVTSYSDLYLDYGGPTIAQMASGASAVSSEVGPDGGTRVYGAGHPFVWGAAIIIAFFGIGWLAHYLGRGEEFANSKVSAITIVVSGASAALFIYAMKLVALWAQGFAPGNGFSAWALGL